MAETPKRPPPTEEEETVADPKAALERLSDLTRRVIAVPKSEVPPIMTKPKKRAKRKRHG